MDPRLAEEPATRWDRLVAVLEDVDPARVIDASHIIERERKLHMADLELFYVLSIHYQGTDSRVLNEVLSLYVLVATWMDWLQRCDQCLAAHAKPNRSGNRGCRCGGNCAPDAGCRSALLESSVTIHNRLHPVSTFVRTQSPSYENELDSSVAGSVTGSVAASSVASPLMRSVTTILTPRDTSDTASATTTLPQKGSPHRPWTKEGRADEHLRKSLDSAHARLRDAAPKSGNVRSITQPGEDFARPPPLSLNSKPTSTTPQPQRDAQKSFLAKFVLPPNWTEEGTVDFLRDGKVLCELVEATLGVAAELGGCSNRRRGCSANVASPTARYDARFPSLADLDKLASKSGGRGSNPALDQLHNVTVMPAKSRGGRRSRTSRAMRMMEAQGKTAAETGKAVSHLNHLCEEFLGWSHTENDEEHFFTLPSTDRMLRPLNQDDHWLVRRLHWLAVALFEAVGDPSIVPLPPRVSFLLTKRSPAACIDDSEENSELAVLIATKCSCLPHNSKLQLVVVNNNVIQVSHPKAHPQPLLYPCCVVEGEAFAFVEKRSIFVPLWHLLRRLLLRWDSTTWVFELPIMEHLADQLLQVGTAAVSATQPLPLTHATGSGVAIPLTPLTPPRMGDERPRRRSLQEELKAVGFSSPDAGKQGTFGSGNYNDSTMSQSRTASSNNNTNQKSVSASFNLTIKTSTIRPTRGSHGSPPPLARSGGDGDEVVGAISSVGGVPTPTFRHPMGPHLSRSFADDPAEDTSTASFAGVATSMVRSGRWTTVSRRFMAAAPDDGSFAAAPEKEALQTRVPLSLAVRAGRAAAAVSPGCAPPKGSNNSSTGAMSPAPHDKDLATTTVPRVEVEVEEQEQDSGGASVKPRLTTAMKPRVSRPLPASQAPRTEARMMAVSPLHSPNSLAGGSPTSGSFLSLKDADTGQGRNLATTSPSSGDAISPNAAQTRQPTQEGFVELQVPREDASGDMKPCLSGEYDLMLVEESNGPEPASIASATLSAVHPTTQANVEVKPLGSPAQSNEGSFREETLTPPQQQHEDSDTSHSNNTYSTYYRSEYLRVKNFSATVVHENHESGINVRDHHFRVSGRPVGKGAFGAVYRALDLETGVIVAVKQSRYSIDTNDQNHLNWREFQTWSMLPAHPNVITFYGASKEVETRQLLLVLEFASGGSIVAMYQNYRPIPEHLFLQHAAGIALGLKHLHDHNVIHGDMKPENVLTRSDGSVAITDFGCSRLTLRSPSDDAVGAEETLRSSAMCKSGADGGIGAWQLLGTAAFMAPEVITNEPDFKSDVWAYVCTLGYLWLGRAPWSEVPETMNVQDSIPLMFFIASNEDAVPFTPEQIAQTPRWMQRLAHRAFVHDVEKRANMAEVISILAEYR